MAKPEKYKNVIKLLRSKNWELKRQNGGSHELWGPKNSLYTFPLVQHKGEISPGVMRKLIVALETQQPTTS
jgi:predicted RNA binding protein YcfA (HicA-like mRNA interferase family)